MTKKLEEEFNLPPIEEALADQKPAIEDGYKLVKESQKEIEVISHGLSVAEKINDAFKEIYLKYHYSYLVISKSTMLNN